MNAEQYNLIVVAGPTAVGKTQLCVELAHRFSCDIISADSRQLYKEMRIGTAKPGTSEQGGIRHWFVDSHSIHHPLTAGQYEIEALAKIKECFKKNNNLILSGGTGLFIKAVLEGFDPLPPQDLVLRNELEQAYKENGIRYLQIRLKDLSPEVYAKIDIQNPRRIIRQIEILKAAPAQQPQKKAPRIFRPIKICLEMEREKLYHRINTRVDQMISDGLIDEAKELYPHKGLKALQTVGYQELFSYFDKEIDLNEAIRLIKRNSRRYAKRQMTWFRNQGNWEYIFPNIEKVLNKINYIK